MRAYFEEGGRRLYVSRVVDATANRALATISSSPSIISFEARHRGAAGNFSVTLIFKAGENILGVTPRDPSQPLSDETVPILRGVRAGDMVLAALDESPLADRDLYEVEDFIDEGRNTYRLRPAVPSSPTEVLDLSQFATVHLLTVSVIVGEMGRFGDQQSWEGLNFRPNHSQSFFTVFQSSPASRRTELYVPLVVNVNTNERLDAVTDLLEQNSLTTAGGSPGENILASLNDDDSTDAERSVRIFLTNGDDGPRLSAGDYEGSENEPKSGIKTLEDLEDISIVAAPGSTHNLGGDTGSDIRRLLIAHCEKMRYRVAVLDSVDMQLISEIRNDRSSIDSTRAGIYYPWIEIADPLTETDILLPPSGFVTGIFARNDIERGVHKAPANEVLRLAKSLEVNINKSQQEVLNPDGINVIRFFEGRGYRIWGARTVTSDPEWKYMNVRRYFAYLERSIEKGTQWAVFENNGRTLWSNVQSTIKDFLFNEWKEDRLAGATPDEAFFVRCDRSTMTQNDIDNGRMICLIGVAPLKPAEFVIFRIGQKTLDSEQ